MSDELEKAYKKRGAWRAEKYLPPALAHHSLLITHYYFYRLARRGRNERTEPLRPRANCVNGLPPLPTSAGEPPKAGSTTRLTA
jgi:hypothetical protein